MHFAPSESVPPQTAPLAPKQTHLYFAYGSNLSPTQMKQRCRIHPALSATPIAIASLPAWKWLVCETGFANVLPPPSLRTGSQKKSPALSSGTDIVYGVLYEMHPRDEERLDFYEGVDHSAKPVHVHGDGDGIGEDGIDSVVRPREQGVGSYNKWYLCARVERWLGSEDHVLRGCGGDQVPVLVYVDEKHVVPSPARKEYIARMERGIIEAGALGLSREWVEEAIRPFILE